LALNGLFCAHVLLRNCSLTLIPPENIQPVKRHALTILQKFDFSKVKNNSGEGNWPLRQKSKLVVVVV